MTDIEKQCLSKNSYDTEEDAIHMARFRKKETGGLILYPYLCPNCNTWHLTKTAVSGKRFSYLKVVEVNPSPEEERCVGKIRGLEKLARFR